MLAIEVTLSYRSVRRWPVPPARRSGPRCHTAHVRRCLQTCWPGWPPARPTWSHPARSARVAPRRFRWRSAWTRSPGCCWTGCRTRAPVAWSASPRPRSATAWICCLAPWLRSGTASPTGPSSPPSTSCASGLRRWPAPARGCAWTDWRPGSSDPASGATRRCCTTPCGTPIPPRACRSVGSGATCCGWMAAGRAAATSTSSWSCRDSARCWTPPRSSAWWTEGSGGWPTTRALACACRGPTHRGPPHRRPAGVQPPPGGAARAGGAVDRPSGQRLGAAPLAGPAVPGPGRLPGRRRAGLPGPLAPPGSHVNKHHGHPQ
jgi:hypothetical protein